MGCMGCFAVPVNFLKWCFNSGKKGFIVLGITVAMLTGATIFIAGQVNKSMHPAGETEIVLPSETVAPYQVTTWSRQYYATTAVKSENGDVTMTDYWELMGDKWRQNKGVIILEASGYGEILIRKR